MLNQFFLSKFNDENTPQDTAWATLARLSRNHNKSSITIHPLHSKTADISSPRAISASMAPDSSASGVVAYCVDNAPRQSFYQTGRRQRWQVLAASESSHRSLSTGCSDESNLTISMSCMISWRINLPLNRSSVMSHVGLVDFGHSRRKFWQWICAFTSEQPGRSWMVTRNSPRKGCLKFDASGPLCQLDLRVRPQE